MIKVENLKKTYDRRTKGAKSVLHGLSFTLPDTGFVCILGASGCGKTTLLNALGGLDRFDSGKIITESAEISSSSSRAMELERNSSFGYIFQNYYLLSEHSVAYNILLGMHSLPLSLKDKMLRVKDALAKVDMSRYARRAVGQLSGGQQQRVAIARAIARNPKVIFADEPTGNLDDANTTNICNILKTLSKESLVVMVTHEERIAKFFADRIITLEDGNIISDSTDWDRGSMDAGEKDAIYSSEYTEERAFANSVSLRVLTAEGAEPTEITVIAEKDRIIIKTNDKRVVLCSEVNSSPKLVEGERPTLTEENFTKNEKNSEKSGKADTGKTKKAKKHLGFGFLVKEARFLVSSKRLSKIGTAVFIVLLSLMLALSVSDIVTTAHINPEDFITTDSHTLSIRCSRGENVDINTWKIDEYRLKYMEHLDNSGLDFDYMLSSSAVFKYTDATVPQLGEISLSFDSAIYVNISRLDASTIIIGRMPERSDEIVIDRWIIDKMLEEEGILQNVIPNREYLIGKKLTVGKRTFSPTIVGICDSGEPNMYLSTEALLSIGAKGIEAISFSEFCRISGYSASEPLSEEECIVLADNAGSIYLQMIGKTYTLAGGRSFKVKNALQRVPGDISAKVVVADSYIEKAYRYMIESLGDFSIWCADKEAAKEFIDGGLPDDISNMLDIDVYDQYQTDYTAYQNETFKKVDARTIVTLSVLLLSLVMLYLMQRSKINSRMDLIAVYRLLGIPKRNLIMIFLIESITATLKYAVPTVLLSWLSINIMNSIEEIGLSLIYPTSAMLITLITILAVRLLISVMPVIRLLYKPPAILAGKYDF